MDIETVNTEFRMQMKGELEGQLSNEMQTIISKKLKEKGYYFSNNYSLSSGVTTVTVSYSGSNKDEDSHKLLVGNIIQLVVDTFSQLDGATDNL